jgi:Ser/Thr protein kinase RdoA (MazF antagonist)
VVDYQQRLDADVAVGWLAAPVARLARQILDAYEFRFAHGDPLPSNALLAAPEPPVWIDFEHSGMYPPATDLAVVAVTLGLHDPSARERCRQQAETQGLTAPYAAMLVQLLTRERRLHDELFNQPGTSAQLCALDAFAEAAVTALVDSARGVSD